MSQSYRFLTALIVSAGAFCLPAQNPHYVQTNLVSDVPGIAARTDKGVSIITKQGAQGGRRN